MADRPEAGRKLKLGDRVRFTRQMASFRVIKHHGSGAYTGGSTVSTRDPQDGYRSEDARARCKELTASDAWPGGRPGTYRIVIEWEPMARREYDLLNKDEGIIVGKTFRYEGEIEYEDGYSLGCFSIESSYKPARRVECWQVKQTLNRKPVLVPLDAVELIS